MATSTKTKRRNAAQLAADGFAALVEKLGMADAVRYMQLCDHGNGDYARERHNWLDKTSLNQIANLMASADKSNARKRKIWKSQKAATK